MSLIFAFWALFLKFQTDITWSILGVRRSYLDSRELSTALFRNMPIQTQISEKFVHPKRTVMHASMSVCSWDPLLQIVTSLVITKTRCPKVMVTISMSMQGILFLLHAISLHNTMTNFPIFLGRRDARAGHCSMLINLCGLMLRFHDKVSMN